MSYEKPPTITQMITINRKLDKQVRGLKAKLTLAKQKIKMWEKHNGECRIPRFSALDCTCGLFKEIEP